MYKIGHYEETDRMSDLICNNYPMLLVLSRFGLSLGFGDRTIREVCQNNGVDVTTFLTVVNLLVTDEPELFTVTHKQLSVEALVNYLHRSHDYFLDFRLPAIRRKLIEAIDCSHSDIAFAIIRFFDEYVAEVRKHMMYEEDTVFPYVRLLLSGEVDAHYNISVFQKQHNQVEAKLTELKNIIIKYYPAGGSNELNSVLFDIFSCAQDLASHNYIEDHLFIPVITEIETEYMKI